MVIMPTATNGFIAMHAVRDTLPVERIRELQETKARPDFQPFAVPSKGMLGWGLGGKIDIIV